MQTTLSAAKINVLMDTQLLYPDVIKELMEQYYNTAKNNYIFKNKTKFNFMKFGYDSEQTLKQQFETIFPNYRELHKELDLFRHLHYLEPWQVSEFKFLFKIHSCLVVLQKIMRLHQMSGNPCQISYDEMGWINFFWKNYPEIKAYVKSV